MKKVASLAQLAEQLICNQQVLGSTPRGGSIFSFLIEHDMDQDEHPLDDAGILATIIILKTMPDLKIRVKRKKRWKLLKVSQLTNKELSKYVSSLGTTVDEVTSELSEIIFQQSNVQFAK